MSIKVVKTKRQRAKAAKSKKVYPLLPTKRELRLADEAQDLAETLSKKFHDHFDKVTKEYVQDVDPYEFSDLVYDVIRLFAIREITNLNENNNISLEHALCNIGGLTQKMKSFMDKNWMLIEHARNTKQ